MKPSPPWGWLHMHGLITNATMRFFVKIDGFWTTRQSGNALVFEMKFPRLVPTIRTSTGALVKPTEWESLSDKTLFNISPWSHVV